MHTLVVCAFIPKKISCKSLLEYLFIVSHEKNLVFLTHHKEFNLKPQDRIETFTAIGKKKTHSIVQEYTIIMSYYLIRNKVILLFAAISRAVHKHNFTYKI